MANDWKEASLGDIVNFTPKRTIKKGTTAPFISMADVTENSKFIKEVFEKEYTGGGSRFANGDTLFARITPCLQNGKCSKVSGMENTEIGHGSTEFIVMAAKMPEYDEDYIYYLARLPKFRAYAESRMIGSTGRQRVSWQDLEEYEFAAPPPNERKDIGSFLSSLDDKIELNHQMNETLEAMAQALFKSWFVDFDPVIDNALAAGNTIPDELLERTEQRKATEIKDNSDIQKLFPDEFEFTEEMGWIPKGWENGILADICSYGKGKINTSELTLENYVSTENMNKEKSGISHAANIASTNQVPKFSVGQTLISNIRPYFKKIWLASFSGGRSNDVLSFQAHKSVANEYLFNLLYQDSFFDYMTATSKGTKMPRGDKAAIMSWSVAIPSSKLMEEFSELAKPVYLANNLRSLQTIELAKLRDTLLPKLMSGELRIPDAARLVDEII